MKKKVELKPIRIWYKPNKDGSIKLFVHRHGHPIEEIPFFGNKDTFVINQEVDIND